LFLFLFLLLIKATSGANTPVGDLVVTWPKDRLQR